MIDDGQMGGQTTDGRWIDIVGGCVDKCIDSWLDSWVDGWVDRWVDR